MKALSIVSPGAFNSFHGLLVTFGRNVIGELYI